MVLFDEATNARLAAIEKAEGMPTEEFVREAVGVWSYLRADERRILGIQAIKMVVQRELELGGQA